MQCKSRISPQFATGAPKFMIVYLHAMQVMYSIKYTTRRELQLIYNLKHNLHRIYWCASPRLQTPIFPPQSFPPSIFIFYFGLSILACNIILQNQYNLIIEVYTDPYKNFKFKILFFPNAFLSFYLL